jgi:hypothetical protein
MSPGVAQLTNQTPSRLVISNLESKSLWGMITRQIRRSYPVLVYVRPKNEKEAQDDQPNYSTIQLPYQL